MKEILKFPSGWLFQQPEIQKMMVDSKGDKPLEPLAPKSFELDAKEWDIYAEKRDKARGYAKENDLRGTF